MSADGQRTIWFRNIAENFNRLSRAHERYRQTDRRQPDGRPMTYSEREREFTFAFAKNWQRQSCKAFIGLTIHAKNISGKRLLLPEILGQTDRVGAN